MATRALIIYAFLAAIAGQAAPLPDVHHIREGGRWNEYLVALDEVHERRQVRSIPAEKDAEALRAKLRGNPTADLVLYPKGAPHDEQSRRLLTRDIALQVQPGTDARS